MVKMKTIIKEGKKEFTATCPRCGCEFKYELEDISFWSVQCPYCDYFISHKDQSEQDTAKRHNLGGTVITTYPPKYINDIDIPSSFCRSNSSEVDNTIITTTYNDSIKNKYE